MVLQKGSRQVGDGERYRKGLRTWSVFPERGASDLLSSSRLISLDVRKVCTPWSFSGLANQNLHLWSVHSRGQPSVTDTAVC